jgi:cell division septum initiation protein DivIVA
MKNNQLEMEKGHFDGYVYEIRNLIDDFVREIEDLEFDKDRLQDRIDELEEQLNSVKDL